MLLHKKASRASQIELSFGTSKIFSNPTKEDMRFSLCIVQREGKF